MFNKSLLIKVMLAMIGLGGLTAMALYSGVGPTDFFENFPGSSNQDTIDRPNDDIDIPDVEFPSNPALPEITDQKKENNCGTFVWWWDNELHEDNVFFYRRIVGVTNFTPIKVTGPHAGQPGSFGEGNLPPGTYEYKVSVVNENGEAFSNVSLPITIDSEVCSDNTIPDKPLNPVITSLDRLQENTCTIRVQYEDHSLDEDGIRIYREKAPNSDLTLIAELPASDAPAGYYDDINLPTGVYRYRVSVFKEGSESFSQYSDEFAIADTNCDQYGGPVIQLPTVGPVNLPSGSSQACIWTSAINVFIRMGPSSTLYSEIDAVVAGVSFPVVGQSEDGQFWALELKPGVVGYVGKAEKFGKIFGECNPPTLQDPPAPAGEATEVPSDGGAITPACRDGVDNDGDTYVDMRDRDCANPDDTSE